MVNTVVVDLTEQELGCLDGLLRMAIKRKETHMISLATKFGQNVDTAKIAELATSIRFMKELRDKLGG